MYNIPAKLHFIDSSLFPLQWRGKIDGEQETQVMEKKEMKRKGLTLSGTGNEPGRVSMKTVGVLLNPYSNESSE